MSVKAQHILILYIYDIINYNDVMFVRYYLKKVDIIIMIHVKIVQHRRFVLQVIQCTCSLINDHQNIHVIYHTSLNVCSKKCQ